MPARGNRAEVLDLLVFVPLSDTGEPQNIATRQAIAAALAPVCGRSQLLRL